MCLGVVAAGKFLFLKAWSKEGDLVISISRRYHRKLCIPSYSFIHFYSRLQIHIIIRYYYYYYRHYYMIKTDYRQYNVEEENNWRGNIQEKRKTNVISYSEWEESHLTKKILFLTQILAPDRVHFYLWKKLHNSRLKLGNLGQIVGCTEGFDFWVTEMSSFSLISC